MSLLAVGVSHQTAPVALLEQFAMGPDDRVKALHELVGSDYVSEALVLATCNRIEVFAEVEKFHGGVTDVSRVLARQAGATVEELSPYVTVHYEDQAVAHLFTVAAGLESMVVGETQVLGQLRAACASVRLLTTTEAPRRVRVVAARAPMDPAPTTSTDRPSRLPIRSSARSRATETSEAPARSIPVSVCTRLPTRSARWATGCSARPTAPSSRARA